MINRKIQATIVLLLMVIGFLFTYNHGLWYVKIINAGFLAGIIGGLADWFAITALFRKPLGFISLGTEILPKNRERIIGEIVKFIGEDILNTDYLMIQLKNISLAKTIDQYLHHKKAIKSLDELLGQFIPLLAPHLQSVLFKLVEQTKIQVYPGEAKAWSRGIYKEMVGEKQDGLLIALMIFLANFGQGLLNKKFIHQFMDYHLDALKEKYVGNNFARSVAVGFMDLSGEDLARKINLQLEDFKGELPRENSRTGRYYQIKIARKLRTLLKDPNNWEQILNFLKNNIDPKFMGENNKMLHKVLQEEIRTAILTKLAKKQQLEDISNWIKAQVLNYLAANSQVQLSYLHQQLNRYSNEELIALVENKVGDDLQMIRINGSVVGAMAGMILAAISLGVERLWG